MPMTDALEQRLPDNAAQLKPRVMGRFECFTG
jgi:hypothetical protein